MDYVIARLKEPATWVGLVSIAGSLLSWKIAPEQAAQISTGLATLAGLILAGTKAHGSE